MSVKPGHSHRNKICICQHLQQCHILWSECCQVSDVIVRGVKNIDKEAAALSKKMASDEKLHFPVSDSYLKWCSSDNRQVRWVVWSRCRHQPARFLCPRPWAAPGWSRRRWPLRLRQCPRSPSSRTSRVPTDTRTGAVTTRSNKCLLGHLSKNIFPFLQLNTINLTQD